jgi:hypothetical protein
MSILTCHTALALENQAIRAIAEAPKDFLTRAELDTSGHDDSADMELCEREMVYRGPGEMSCLILDNDCGPVAL